MTKPHGQVGKAYAPTFWIIMAIVAAVCVFLVLR
jgi:hypothetical protein